MNSKEFFKAEFDENKDKESDKKESSKTEIEGKVFKDKIEMVRNLNENIAKYTLNIDEKDQERPKK